MSIDVNINKKDANYSWKCPYCEKEQFTKWNKSCFYQIVEHCQDEHLEECFKDIISRHTAKGKKQLLDNHWCFFGESIKTLDN